MRLGPWLAVLGVRQDFVTNNVQGGIGSYNAGNLFLFPWLKPSGVAFGANQVR